MNILEQGLLKYLTSEQLTKIQSVSVGIGGAGGLGSNLAIILVRSGFKKLEIIDHDVIDSSNLNRQQYYADEVGKPKVAILKNRLLAINPDLKINAWQKKWTVQDGDIYFHNCQYIAEAFDQTIWKHNFVDYYHNKTNYMVSGVGMAGLLSKEPMKIRKVGNIYFCGDGQTDSAAGNPPMAPRVTMCAAMMAEIILDLSLGLTPRI